MFSSDKNIDLLAKLIRGLRRYGELRLEELQVDVVSKSTMALTALIIGAILFAIVGVVVFFLSLALLFVLATYVGYAWAACVVAGGYCLLAIIAYRLRHRLIMDPIARLLTALLLEPSSTTPNQASEEEAFIHSEQSSGL